MLSLALGCSGPAPEPDSTGEPSSQTQSQRLSGHALPPGLAPSLVRDVQPGLAPVPSWSDSSRSRIRPVTLGATSYFVALDENSGDALWRTDGTPQGTRLVRQFVTSTQSLSSSWELAAAGDTVYLIAFDENLSTALWASDGTPEGTVKVSQPAGEPLLHPHSLTACGGRVFFGGARGYQGGEGLWTLEGSPQHPVLLAPVGIPPSFEGPNTNLLCMNGTLFFVGGWDGSLWKSDGTPGGTVPVASLGYLSWVEGPVLLGTGSRLFVNTGDWMSPVWTSDGTAEGTHPLEGVGGGLPVIVHAAAGGHLFYSAIDTSIWRWTLRESDGTTDHALLELPSDLRPSGLSVGDSVLISGWDRLYRSDGTPEGTVVLGDLSLGFAPGEYSGAPLPDGRLLFAGSAPGQWPELWATDGTPAGTTPLHTSEGLSLSRAASLTRLGGQVLFWGDEGLHGQEPWVTDGTPAGTHLLRDLSRATSSQPQSLTDVRGTLFFSASDAEHGNALWKSDGTPEGTLSLMSLGTGSWADAYALTDVDGALFFFRGAYPTVALWTSDGTPAGTVKVHDFGPAYGTAPVPRAVLGSSLVFTASGNATQGQELWKSDGTAEGTLLLKDIFPGKGHSFPTKLTRAGDTLFFLADDGVHGREPWKTDGTAEGTLLVKDIFPGARGATSDYGFQDVHAVGTSVFFTADDGVHGAELWKSDGTAGGTVLVADLQPGAQGSNPYDMVEVGGTLFFTADDGVHGRELWRSNGTPEGTVLVMDLAPGAASSFLTTPQVQQRPPRLYAVGGALYFAANDGVHGTEPWKSDGTAGGTVLLRDVLPGPEDSGTGLTPFVTMGHHGAFVFSASDGASGLELWTSDGTPEGTHRFADLNPGPSSAAPLQLTVSGSRLFFVADEGVHGRELWNVKQAAFQGRP